MEGRPLLLTELAPLIGVPLSSCHGLVKTLLDSGYLYGMSRRRGFYPTRKLFTLARSIAAKDASLVRLEPHIEALRDMARETVIVGTRQGDAVLYLQVEEGPETIRYSARPGDFKPLHSSAIGKALLARDGTAMAEKLRNLDLPAVTAQTITDRDRLLADLAAGSERGYFVTHDENVADVTAVARSIDIDGMILGIAIAGPSYRMQGRIDAMIGHLLPACDAMERDAR